MTGQRRDERKGGNQGEGNREAARAYNEEQQEFVGEGRVGEAAEEAKRAVESEEERARLEEAEQEGQKRAKEFDPNVKRDY